MSGYRVGGLFALVVSLGAAGFMANEIARPTSRQSPLFESLDGNGDGLISSEECRLAPELRALCATADRNSDGVVDSAEFAALERRARSAPRIEPYVLPSGEEVRTKAI